MLKRFFLYPTLLATLLLLLAGEIPITRAQSQDAESPWITPVNLSNSGGGQLPLLSAEPGGNLHILWWDQFDHARYRTGNEIGGWGEALDLSFIKTGKENTSPALWRMLTDKAHQIHIFFQDKEGNLWYTRAAIGSFLFIPPEQVADTLVNWDVQIDQNSIVSLVYMRAGGGTLPAGVYYRRTLNGKTWEANRALAQSPYMRSLKPEEASISLAIDGISQVLVNWVDPIEKKVTYVYSNDKGNSFSNAALINPGEAVQNLTVDQTRLIYDPSGNFKLLWQSTTPCGLYQQEWLPPQVGTSPSWGPSQRILETVSSCIQIGNSFPLNNSGLALTLRRGLASDRNASVLLTTWDGKRWSDALTIQVNFIDPLTQKPVSLGCPDFSVVQDRLLVVGCDAKGDIWFTKSTGDISSLFSFSESRWREIRTISTRETRPADLPSLTIDNEGRLHALFPVLPVEVTSIYTAYGLAYTHQEEPGWSQPSTVFHSPELAGPDAIPTNLEQPFILADAGGMLHAAWSSGATGTTSISSVFLGDAALPPSWSKQRALTSVSPLGNSPVLATNNSGKLFAAFSIPINEKRGIYLVSSEDEGANWSDPQPIFTVDQKDANIQANWPVFGTVSLVVDKGGILHAAWSRSGLPPDSIPMGVFYARSSDSGQTWTEPIQLGAGPSDKPQLVISGSNQLALFWVGVTLDGPELDQQVTTDAGITWSGVSRTLVLQTMAPNIGLAGDGNSVLYLVGLERSNQDTTTLVTMSWDGAQWSEADHELLGFAWAEGSGVKAAVLPSGKLVAVFIANSPNEIGDLRPILVSAERPITIQAAVPMPTYTPRPQPTPIVTLTATVTATPLPTPNLSGVPAPSISNKEWIEITGILVGMIIVVVISVRGLMNRIGRR